MPPAFVASKEQVAIDAIWLSILTSTYIISYNIIIYNYIAILKLNAYTTLEMSHCLGKALVQTLPEKSRHLFHGPGIICSTGPKGSVSNSMERTVPVSAWVQFKSVPNRWNSLDTTQLRSVSMYLTSCHSKRRHERHVFKAEMVETC